MDLNHQREHYIYVTAHRGWLNRFPENTMEAFVAAAELGVDQIETDVRITADNQLVLIHDARVDRVTDGTGLVRDMTLAQLQKLDAGSYRGPAYAGCRIPAFTDFLTFIQAWPELTVGLELKEYIEPGREAEARRICDLVLATVDAYGLRDRVIFNTMNGPLHDYIHETYGHRYRQSVYYPPSRQGDCRYDPYSYAYGCFMMPEQRGMGLRMASREAFEFMKQRGIQRWIGTGVRDEAGIDEFIAVGGQLIVCDNPDEILQILREKGYHD